MVDSYLKNERDERVYHPGLTRPTNVFGHEDKSPHPASMPQRKPDKTPEEIEEELNDIKSDVEDFKEKVDKYSETFKKWSAKKADYARRNGSSLAPIGKLAKLPYGKKPVPWSIGGDVAWWILNPPLEPNTTAPDWEIPIPDIPIRPVGGDQTPICGMGPIIRHVKYEEGMPTALVQYRIRLQLFLQRQYPSSGDLGIVKVFDTVPYGSGCRRYDGIKGQKRRGGGVYTTHWTQVRGTIPYSGETYVSPVSHRKPRSDWDGYRIEGPLADAGLDSYFPVAERECSIPIIYVDPDDPIKPDDYDREKDEDNMGCQWQKDEVEYDLPELKIGARKIGGGKIKIDDGLVPLADYMIKAMGLMHSGLGLDLLDAVELPTNVLEPTKNKVKHKSIAALTQWQFDNVSSLVGLPIKNTLTTIDDKTSDLEFRSVQDALSFMFHQQKESDTDLTVLEGYCTRIAQQLEAVTQICLRQHADIEMIIQELGFKYKTETKTRPSLYKIGMKDDDEKTGVIELFKGGTVSYPVRIWADEHDQRQIAMRTNLYAEISARSILQTKNTNSEIQGLDARKRMGKNNTEDWNEYIKTINEPEDGVLNGGTIPYIEEYVSGSVTAKKVPAPTSGLSLFMKPKTKGKK